MSKPRKPRKPKMNVAACITMAEFRNEMRQRAYERRAFAKANAPWRRIVGKLVALAIIGSITTVIVAHAIAYTASPVLMASH